MSDTYEPGNEPVQDAAVQEPNPPDQPPAETTPPGAEAQEPNPPDQPPTETAPPASLDEPPEKTWQDYASDAIRSLYPHMREGVDYAFGKRNPDDKPSLLEQDEKFAAIDMGHVQEVSQKMLDGDPIGKPPSKPPLGQTRVDDPENTKLSKL